MQPHLDAAVSAAVNLVAEDDLQEGGVVQLLPARQGDALGQGGGHGPQLEPLEQRREIVCTGHGSLLKLYGGDICQSGRRLSRAGRSGLRSAA